MARRIVTAREQHEMLSPWRLAAPIWQKIPADLDWGNDFEEQGEGPPLSYSQRQETDQPTGKWYHVSTQPLGVGTKVVPKGGPSPDPDFYDDPNETGYNNSNRQNYVWLAPSLASAYSWSLDLGAPHIHEVKPGDKPQPWNFSGTNGWVSPHAHVVRQVSEDEAKAASEEYYAGLRQKAHEEWLSQATPEEIEELTALSQQSSKTARVAMFDPMAVTNRLKGEFHDWFHSLPPHRLDELRNIEMHPFMDHHEDNPVSHWPTVERFLKDKYPAAHRGFMTGHEDASMWLDDPNNEYESPMLEGDDEFGSLPPPEPYSSADHEKLGYDPQEVAAGMVLLHNRAHSGRQDTYLNTDKKRLVDIFNKRQQMQRNYEQRTGATYWHITDHPDFQPDPSFRPENNGTLGGHFDPGLFVSQHPDHWMQSYGYYRPYVSEIDVPDEVGQDFHNSPERFITPDQYDKIKVKRTIPVDAYAREQYGESGWVESSYGEDFETGEKFTDFAPGSHDLYKKTPGYKYPGTAMDQPEEWRKTYERKVRDYQQRTPGIIAGRY